MDDGKAQGIELCAYHPSRNLYFMAFFKSYGSIWFYSMFVG